MGMIRSSITVTEGTPSDGSGVITNLEAAIAEPIPAGVQIPTDTIAVARINVESGYQEVRINLRDEGFDPSLIVVQKGIQAALVINNDSLEEGNATLVFPLYRTKLSIKNGDNIIGLLPSEDFVFSTVDSVFFGYVKAVDDLNNIDSDDIKEEVSKFETMLYEEE
jgi:hypothetical protein